MLVTRNHSKISTTTVTTLIVALLPAPGTLNALVFSALPLASTVAGAEGAAAAIGTVATMSGMSRLAALRAGGRRRRLAVVNDREHFLAQRNEGGLRLDPARVAVVEEL